MKATKKQTAQAITKWNKATEELTKLFVKKYFGEYYEYDANDWVAGDVGSVIYINDYWFDLSRIKEALELNATKNQLFEYSDYELQMGMKNKRVEYNFENFVKYVKGFGA